VGDEFQGILKSSRSAYDVYLFLKENIPAGFYCGIGVEEVEKTKKGMGMRGTTFYRVREALESCKKKKRNVPFASNDHLFDKIINTIFYFIESIES